MRFGVIGEANSDFMGIAVGEVERPGFDVDGFVINSICFQCRDVGRTADNRNTTVGVVNGDAVPNQFTAHQHPC